MLQVIKIDKSFTWKLNFVNMLLMTHSQIWLLCRLKLFLICCILACSYIEQSVASSSRARNRTKHIQRRIQMLAKLSKNIDQKITDSKSINSISMKFGAELAVYVSVPPKRYRLFSYRTLFQNIFYVLAY